MLPLRSNQQGLHLFQKDLQNQYFKRRTIDNGEEDPFLQGQPCVLRICTPASKDTTSHAYSGSSM